ncbi:MAG: hypothetical protein HPY65_16790 [Syntrophaceae bacterium]|nr:hypothetical protein [Syntrophaceae bacterium]
MDCPSILIACHDAGAANALSRLVGPWKSEGMFVQAVTMQYASEVFSRSGIRPDRAYDADMTNDQVCEVLDQIEPDAVLLGSSLDSQGERLLAAEARKRGIRTAGLVDWWSNFGQRFSAPGTRDLRFLPDIVAVPDDDAREGCIAEGIPAESIRITGNPYWEDLIGISRSLWEFTRNNVRTCLNVPPESRLILIVSGNIRNLGLDLGYDEGDLFGAIASLSRSNGIRRPVCWAVKPHPRESLADLRDLMAASGLREPLILADTEPLDAVCAADGVFGMCSSLLFEAALLGKRVVSFQPNLNRDKLEYFRIFRHIGIPVLTDTDPVRDVLATLAGDQGQVPDLSRLPRPIGRGTAGMNLKQILMGDWMTRRSHGQPLPSC